MEILLVSAYTIIFLLIIRYSPFFRFQEIGFKIIATLFVLKILAGLALSAIYAYYYNNRENSDIFKYYDDSAILFSALSDNPLDYLRMLTGYESDSPHLYKYYEQMGFWIKPDDYDLYNDNQTVIRFNAFIRLFSFGCYNVHMVFMNFISFTGLIYILKVLQPFFKGKKYGLLFIVFLLPSVLLWTSGVLKEGLLMFGIGMFVYYIFGVLKKFSFEKTLLIALSVLILLVTKFYVLFAMIPGALSLLFIRLFPKVNRWLVFGIVHVFIIALFFNSSLISKYDLPGITSKKQHDFINMINNTENVGSRIDIPELSPGFFDFVKNSPVAVFNVMFRPLPGDVNSMIMIPAFLENLLIWLIIFIAIFFRLKKIPEENIPLILFCISFTAIPFILVGLTTPVIGAIVRYKAPALPFLLAVFLMIIDKDKILRLLKRNK